MPADTHRTKLHRDCFRLHIYKDQSLREVKYSSVLSEPDGYTENIYNREKYVFF